MINYPLPVLGFCAYSGTGKTTLLKQLIPLLNAENIRVAVIKHAHHNFDVDYPQKDSCELRRAGASKMMIISKKRVAMIEEFDPTVQEPTLQQSLDLLDPSNLDLVLVEGFKKEQFPKIELFRAKVNKPLIFPSDPNIIAFSSDEAMPNITKLRQLDFIDLNEPNQFIQFIKNYVQQYVSPNEKLQCLN